MVYAARHDIRVRGYQNVTSVFSDVLKKLAALVPLEAVMDDAGKRMMMTYPPYSLSFEASIPAILAEVAQQVKSTDGDRPRYNPFYQFEEASEAVVAHYREVAEGANFKGGLLEKWTVDFVISCAEVHIYLLTNIPVGADAFIDTVAERLRWFIFAVAAFFREKKDFPYHNARDACARLAIVGMSLLQCACPELAEACGEVISAIASRNAEAENHHRTYGFADCMVKLEQLARAADALGYIATAVACRARYARPESISEENWPEFVDAVKNRTRHMERDLRERPRYIQMPTDSIAVLRRILARPH